MARLTSLLLVSVLLQFRHLVNGYHASSGLMVHSDLNKALYGYSFLNISGITMKNCLERCLANCLCLSFQICENTAVSCQLCSSNKYLKPEAMRESKGCTSFNHGGQYEVSNQRCGQSCMSVINCCLTSNPCLNGGTCLPPIQSSRKRFRCECQAGYKGERCHQPIKSCRGYSNGSRVRGNYTVLDVDMKPFKVFCDFDGTSSMTWTLIQSYKRQYISMHISMLPLFEDIPINQNNPSWFQYRLSKSRMESIQQDSSKWRLTCRYDTDGVVHKDYVLGAKTEMNIITFKNNGSCVKMDYIDIRGQNCYNCTAYWRQKFVILYFESSYIADEKNCDFKPSGSLRCNEFAEKNFGYYDCWNPQHRCSSSKEATTQTWIGGNDQTVAPISTSGPLPTSGTLPTSPSPFSSESNPTSAPGGSQATTKPVKEPRK